MQMESHFSCWIITLGNDQREDDGIGPWVADCLRRQIGHWPDVIIESKPLLDPTLLEEVQEAETLIFVDATSEVQDEPVRWIPVKPDFNGWALDSHHLSPQVFLGLLKSLYQCTPSAWLVAVRGERFELAQQIHALARARAEVAAAQIADWVALQFKANDKKVSHG